MAMVAYCRSGCWRVFEFSYSLARVYVRVRALAIMCSGGARFNRSQHLYYTPRQHVNSLVNSVHVRYR